MFEDSLRSSDIKLAFNLVALITQLPPKAVTETLRNNGEVVILVGVKQNVKQFFRGLVEANLAAQRDMRGYNHYHLR